MTSGLILGLGAAIVGMVFWIDCFSPPAWIHAVIWPVIAVLFAIGLMRPLKAALIAQNYRHRISEMEL